MAFQATYAFLVLELDEKLDVRGTFGPLLKLPRSEDCFSFVDPGLQVGRWVMLRIVERTDPHSELCHVCHRLL